MFCEEIIHADIKHLKQTPCPNAWLGESDGSAGDKLVDLSRAEHSRVEDVFGKRVFHLRFIFFTY